MPDMLWLVVAYLLGSIPFGLVLTRIARTADLRTVGSGNIGATNVMRTGHKKLAVATLLLDLLKGTAAVLLVAQFSADMHMQCYAGLCAVLGHNFPVWLKFKGGKGVATSLGVLLALSPLLALLLACTWGVTFAFSRISSLSALLTALLAPLYAYLITFDIFYLTMVLSILLIVRHHGNIKRLIEGKEGKKAA